MAENWSITSALTNPANAVTAGRILATPFVLLLLANTHGASWITWAVWAGVAFTDMIDGKLARRYGGSRTGVYLDPLSDKILILGALIVLVGQGVFSWVPVALIAFREVAISYYRSMLAKHGVDVPARPWGKAKTFVQNCAVGFVYFPPFANHIPWIADAALWLAVGLAYISAAEYLLVHLKAARSTRRADSI